MVVQTVAIILYGSTRRSTRPVTNLSFQLVERYESADRATAGDTCGPVRPAVQKGMRLLRQRSMAGSVLQVLEGGVPAGTTEADPGRLGLGRKVRPLISGLVLVLVSCTSSFIPHQANATFSATVNELTCAFCWFINCCHVHFPGLQVATRGGGSICQ